MGEDSIPDPTAPPGSLAPRRLPWRLLLLAGLLGAGLALLLGVLFRDAIPGPWQTSGADDHLPPGVLADYVPEDSEAVLVVDLRSLRESPVGSRHLLPSLGRLVRESEKRLRWMSLLGLNPIEDLDSLQVSFAPSRGGEPLWLARGRIDRSRFQVGPDRLRLTTLDHFRAWEYVDRPAKRTTLLAVAGDALLVSDTPGRVTAALEQAHHPHPSAVADAILRDLLAKVDRRQTLWLAASLRSLGSVARLDRVWLEMVLRPLLTHADSVHGGLTCADDIRAELHFHTATPESAAKLEADLKNVCGVASGAPLLFGSQKDLLPLFRLLAAGQTSRDGNDVSLRCRLPADQLSD